MLQRFMHLLLGHNAQKRRLFELYRQRLLERVVEDGITGGVDEIGEDDRVFLGERMGLA